MIENYMMTFSIVTAFFILTAVICHLQFSSQSYNGGESRIFA